MFSYARNSLPQSPRFTLCGYHFNEGHRALQDARGAEGYGDGSTPTRTTRTTS